jgi:hypothetical protein
MHVLKSLQMESKKGLPMIGAKRRTYHIMATRSQIYEFDIVALSPEGACKSLQERLKRDNSFIEPENARPVSSCWLDPSDKGNAWPIEGGDLSKEPDGKTLSVWNGKEIIRFCD